MTIDLTAYDNADFIPDGHSYFERWSEAGAEFRGVEAALGRARLNQAYGTHERERFDLFLPATGKPKGLVIFIHGGFWRMGDRTLWSYLAAGPLEHGWAVTLPSYPLAPEVRIAAITRHIATSVTEMAKSVAGPILLTGHSAGGHLALRMVCGDVELPPEVADRVAGVLAISPLADLNPLIMMPMNADLQIDAVEAQAESPVACSPPEDVSVQVVVGGAERPAFIDQALWLADAWPSVDLRIAPDRHHFNVIDALADPESAMVKDLLTMAEGTDV